MSHLKMLIAEVEKKGDKETLDLLAAVRDEQSSKFPFYLEFPLKLLTFNNYLRTYLESALGYYNCFIFQIYQRAAGSTT